MSIRQWFPCRLPKDSNEARRAGQSCRRCRNSPAESSGNSRPDSKAWTRSASGTWSHRARHQALGRPHEPQASRALRTSAILPGLATKVRGPSAPTARVGPCSRAATRSCSTVLITPRTGPGSRNPNESGQPGAHDQPGEEVPPAVDLRRAGPRGQPDAKRHSLTRHCIDTARVTPSQAKAIIEKPHIVSEDSHPTTNNKAGLETSRNTS